MCYWYTKRTELVSCRYVDESWHAREYRCHGWLAHASCWRDRRSCQPGDVSVGFVRAFDYGSQLIYVYANSACTNFTNSHTTYLENKILLYLQLGVWTTIGSDIRGTM